MRGRSLWVSSHQIRTQQHKVTHQVLSLPNQPKISLYFSTRSVMVAELLLTKWYTLGEAKNEKYTFESTAGKRNHSHQRGNREEPEVSNPQPTAQSTSGSYAMQRPKA